jgi:hypothetical protein
MLCRPELSLTHMIKVKKSPSTDGTERKPRDERIAHRSGFTSTTGSSTLNQIGTSDQSSSVRQIWVMSTDMTIQLDLRSELKRA